MPRRARPGPHAAPASGIAFRDGEAGAGLAPWVASAWTLEVAPGAPAREYTRLPDGCVHLVWREGGAVLLGPQAAARRLPARPGEREFGLRLLPGAARALLGLPPGLSLRGVEIPARELPALAWADGVAGEIEELESPADRLAAARRALRPRRESAALPDPAVARAVAAILAAEPPARVAALAAAAGLSPRQFRRRFVAAVDLSPKELARIWRFRRCVLETAAPGRSWTDRAADHAFADQSHMVREFRRLSGLAPTEFARRLANVEHAGLWRPGGG